MLQSQSYQSNLVENVIGVCVEVIKQLLTRFQEVKKSNMILNTV